MNTKQSRTYRQLTIYCYPFIGLCLGLMACSQNRTSPKQDLPLPSVFVSVLGIAQDAGYPQAGCRKACCQRVYRGEQEAQSPVCLGIVDQIGKISWMIDASPDFPAQYYDLGNFARQNQFGGIWLTHAHIGHYTGLIHLGREVMGARQVPVYTMPRMQHFLDSQAPWSQLVSLQNISLKPIQADSTYILNSQIAIEPVQVPHRSEFSETVGYRISGPTKSLLFIPDIDKWTDWDRDIRDYIAKVDYALLDGTFFANGEIPGRDMSEIPHPFIEESLKLFNTLSPDLRSRIYFTHFNHTNPVLNPGSAERQTLLDEGYRVAEEGMVLAL
ncbi:MAG: MBL fold metallo-hydrolase [Bacteroidota bacterium]